MAAVKKSGNDTRVQYALMNSGATVFTSLGIVLTSQVLPTTKAITAAATLIVIDLRRYEQWVLDAHRAAHERGIWSAGLTDSLLSPIAVLADEHFLVSGGSIGPFDSHVGTLALLNLFAANTASALRDSAAARLAAVEAAWSEHGSLTDGR